MSFVWKTFHHIECSRLAEDWFPVLSLLGIYSGVYVHVFVSLCDRASERGEEDIARKQLGGLILV